MKLSLFNTDASIWPTLVNLTISKKISYLCLVVLNGCHHVVFSLKWTDKRDNIWKQPAFAGKVTVSSALANSQHFVIMVAQGSPNQLSMKFPYSSFKCTPYLEYFHHLTLLSGNLFWWETTLYKPNVALSKPTRLSKEKQKFYHAEHKSCWTTAAFFS